MQYVRRQSVQWRKRKSGSEEGVAALNETMKGGPAEFSPATPASAWLSLPTARVLFVSTVRHSLLTWLQTHHRAWLSSDPCHSIQWPGPVLVLLDPQPPLPLLFLPSFLKDSLYGLLSPKVPWFSSCLSEDSDSS